MNTIFDYIKWRGDLLFNERPCNEIDNLIFSELAYTDMEDIVPGADSDRTIPLSELWERYLALGYDQSDTLNDPLPLLEVAARSERYKQISVGRYINHICEERHVQFSAVTFRIDDQHFFIAFRGTDDTLVGWREDFSISYLSETPGQKKAVDYLNSIQIHPDTSLLVGGHSKGGNLAIYASAFCNQTIRERITRVYSNDGPGFPSKVIKLSEYQEILPKVSMIIPEDSVIGILLSNKTQKKVIKSSAKGGEQHHPYTWLVNGIAFEEADEQSPQSLFLEKTLNQWFEELNDEEREAFTSGIFDAMEEAGLSTLSDINNNRLHAYHAIIKAIRETGAEQSIIDPLLKLAAAGKDSLLDELKKPFENLIDVFKEEKE